MQVFFALGITNLTITRALNYVFVLLPVFAGYTLYHFYTSQSIIPAKLSQLIIVSIITLLLVIGIFQVFPTPMNYQPNDQVTTMELSGMLFLLHKNTELSYVGMSSVQRFADAILGHVAVTKRQDISQYIVNSVEMIPDHFNYYSENITFFGENYNSKKLLYLSKYSEQLYTVGAWKEVGRFNSNEFTRLESDKSADKLYNNGDFKAYITREDVIYG